MSAFSKKNTASEPQPKAPTSYEFYKGGTSGRLKTTALVRLIFPPNQVEIQSWGFVANTVRLNIYSSDPRFEECLSLVNLVVENGWGLRIVYSENDRGLATLDFDKKKRVVYNQKAWFWKVDQSNQ